MFNSHNLLNSACLDDLFVCLLHYSRGTPRPCGVSCPDEICSSLWTFFTLQRRPKIRSVDVVNEYIQFAARLISFCVPALCIAHSWTSGGTRARSLCTRIYFSFFFLVLIATSSKLLQLWGLWMLLLPQDISSAAHVDSPPQVSQPGEETPVSVLWERIQRHVWS